MPLENILPWLIRAQQEHFAIGAFNGNTLEQVQAIAAAALAERAPAIIQVSQNALRYAGNGDTLLGLRYMAAIGRVAAESVPVPIGLHLDHADAMLIGEAVALGFTSVMFDGGDLPLEENIAATVRLRELVHPLDVSLEAEVGEVYKPEGGTAVDAAAGLTEPAAAADFVRATGVDALAIALGSVHGGRSKMVNLDLDRLKAIGQVVSIPLVLHGSSGVADDSIRESVAGGICKVNVATQLNQAFTRGLRAALENSEVIDPRKYLAPARSEMVKQVRERIRFLGANGRA